MKKIYTALFIVSGVFAAPVAVQAQLIGTNIWLQGAYLEIGMNNNGSFGATTPPATYHPCYPGPAPGGTYLAEVYDQGHDGWAVGVPTFRGDYTYPGSPFEGWELQVNGLRNQAFVPAGYAGTGSLTGGLTTYTNTGGSAIGNWVGTAAGGTLQVLQETRIDTFASAVVVTTKFKNTTAAPIPGVYYLRSCDPDDDEAHGGSFPINYFVTYNKIVHQNEDLSHRVCVRAHGGLYSPDSTYMSLATKDCRAVAFIYSSWSISSGVDLATVWGQTYTPADYTLNTWDNGDIAIGIVFNVGTIAPFDSAVISYAYVFNYDSGIDNAFPEPALSVNGTVATTPGPPVSIIDTYNACANPGLTAVPVNILYGSDKSWTWSKWTWSPALGLASTTGVTNTIYTTVLPPTMTYTITGTDSATCSYRTMYLTLITCNNVRANSPCYGDSLILKRVGDSTGCTYFWYGPGGFTSYVQNPFVFPATYADSGEFYVVRTLGGVHDTDSIRVTIQYKPVISASNNSPLCAGMIDTLVLTAGPSIPGETWSWTGPASFTSTLENPLRMPYVPIDTGMYFVHVTTSFGCKDTAQTYATMIQQPLPPVVTGPLRYCQGDSFVNWTVSGLVSGGYIRWYINNTVPVGDTLASPPVVNTLVPGVTTVYFSQRDGSCESHRDSLKIRVVTTPVPPVASGNMSYCQFIGPITTLTVTPTTADTISWYFAATGGTAVYVEPLPSISVAGTYNYWISQTDSGCESGRAPVTITIHPKPAPPIIHPTPICQFWTPVPVSASPSSTGDFLLWYGPGVTAGSTTAPVPGTLVAPDTLAIYVTETTPFGCVSDSSLDLDVIRVHPPMPVTHDIAYCQHASAAPLNGLVDSIANSHLNWYYNTATLNPTPTPFTDTLPGIYTWYVSQTVPNDSTGCESDSAAVSVTIIYKPVFGISVSAPYVCQFDSLALAYCCGPSLFAPNYAWTLPPGATFAAHTGMYDSAIVVQFDTANQNNYVYLTASDDSGFCSTVDTVLIKVIGHPDMTSFTMPDVCINDTVQLALSERTPGAYSFTWYIDNVLLANSNEITLITGNANSGGPYEIKWVDTGMHVIKVTSLSKEGCKSMPAYDSVNVHPHPDASFVVKGSLDSANQFCLEDSVLFSANARNYNYSYEWTPAHYFQNLNGPVIWGKMEQSQSTVVLTVTDPFGCYATSSQTLYPQTCCSVIFPNAFTPDGTVNRKFEPIMSGFHRFHEFRVVNRWGVTVFEGGNTTVQWDGNFNGVPQDMGTYYYYLKYDCGGRTIEAKGDLTLIR